MAYTLLYALGLALVYASLGLLAGLTGTLFGSVSANKWAYFAMANLLLLAALAMLDVFPVTAPALLVAWASKFGGRSPGSVFLMGATSGLVAAPCGAPAFAAVLTFVSGTRSAGLGFLYLFVFSIGMTAVLIAVGLFAGTLAALPRSGRWIVWAKKAGGLLILSQVVLSMQLPFAVVPLIQFTSNRTRMGAGLSLLVKRRCRQLQRGQKLGTRSVASAALR